MPNTVFHLAEPANEPIRDYAPGSPETISLQAELERMANNPIEIPVVIGGKRIQTGDVREWRAPHDQSLVLCKWHAATSDLVQDAITNGQEAWKVWSETPYQVRMAILLKAADLLSGPWRDRINASTMLGQSKTCYQAEIDAACEMADFFRFNAYYALKHVYTEQPSSPRTMWNQVDHRPLEGFVYAVTPFNFTSIAGNLPAAPALMGNVALWKPSESSMLSNYLVLQLLEEAGMPPGVINFVPGNPVDITNVVLGSEHFSGLHFTGSTQVFRTLWKTIGQEMDRYRSYPRIVGETGGKDFIFAHPSADVERLTIAALRGAFEYQGQKCSAASRMYIPRSIWGELSERLSAEMAKVTMGDVRDFSNFMGAVIHEGAYKRISGAIERAKADSGTRVVAGGGCFQQQGWFIEPTLLECTDPKQETMHTELFGPVLSTYVYDDDKLEETLALCDQTSPYGLTGAVWAQDRLAAESMARSLRHAAGNFYINDKPTGAVVNQQPFGGARASGTDDKAGSPLNLMRWVAARSVKETWDAPRDWRYPHMG